jgi:hypothetical protein
MLNTGIGLFADVTTSYIHTGQDEKLLDREFRVTSAKFGSKYLIGKKSRLRSVV